MSSYRISLGWGCWHSIPPSNALASTVANRLLFLLETAQEWRWEDQTFPCIILTILPSFRTLLLTFANNNLHRQQHRTSSGQEHTVELMTAHSMLMIHVIKPKDAVQQRNFSCSPTLMVYMRKKVSNPCCSLVPSYVRTLAHEYDMFCFIVRSSRRQTALRWA